MKIRTTIGFLFCGILFFTAQRIISTPTGAPAGVSGSPSDGNTCYQGGCHVGVPSAVSNIITSNIPAEGYTPGSTYTITVTVTGSGNKGFEVSPQKVNGTYVGTLIAGTGTYITGTKYITHSVYKSSSTATWTFQWKAPVAGTGEVTFYGAFAITRFTTKEQALTIQEKGSAGIGDNRSIFSFNAYPNPVHGVLHLSFDLKSRSNVKINLIGIDGRSYPVIYESMLGSGKQDISLNLENTRSGIYFLEMNVNGEAHFEKIAVN